MNDRRRRAESECCGVSRGQERSNMHASKALEVRYPVCLDCLAPLSAERIARCCLRYAASPIVVQDVRVRQEDRRGGVRCSGRSRLLQLRVSLRPCGCGTGEPRPAPSFSPKQRTRKPAPIETIFPNPHAVDESVSLRPNGRSSAHSALQSSPRPLTWARPSIV